MKIPNIFVPEKDLTNKVNEYMEGREINPQPNSQPASLYDRIKRLYEGLGSQNMFLIYGPMGTGKTVMSDDTKKALSNDYNLFFLKLQPTDIDTLTKGEYLKTIRYEIDKALSENKKVYIDILETEKFSNYAQKALENILEEHKNNKGMVFVFQSTSDKIAKRLKISPLVFE